MTRAEHTAAPPDSAGRPRWSAVLRAVREARGVTLEGWAARIGVSRATVQRWERGERAPDPGAEAAILAYCRDMGLFRSYDRGPLAGLDLTEDLLRRLLAEARWLVRAGPADTAGAPPSERPAASRQDGAPPHPATIPPSNLPLQLTSFVGRERELEQVRRVQAGTRLLTLTGAGGCGKTRLALELAREVLWAYPDGAYLVELASLAGPALLPQTIAAALGLHPTGLRPALEDVRQFLSACHLLLILDNCEHLLPACAELVELLLRACPHLEVMTTSREPLGIGGETVWRVPPLSLTSGSAGGAEPDAVRLFVERARLQRPELALTPDEQTTVAEICRCLDGMPLAIELAAARVNVVSVAYIGERLHDRFRLLASSRRTAVPRHQTLRAAMDWSHDLLSVPEQILLRRLAVFAGGFTLEAAEAICRDAGRDADAPAPGLTAGQHQTALVLQTADVLDLLMQLVDKSLVLAERRDEAMRYRMLETVRQYASEKLEGTGEAAVMRDRHGAWCLALAEAADAELNGPHGVEWLARLEREHNNLRAALAWRRSEAGGAEAGLRLAGALTEFWSTRGHYAEGRVWLEGALAAGSGCAAALQAKALSGAGTIAWLQRDFVAAEAFHTRGLALYREVGNVRGTAFALHNVGVQAIEQGANERARGLYEESLALYRELGDKWGTGMVLNSLGTLASRRGESDQAATLHEQSLAAYRELNDDHAIAVVLGNLGEVARAQGDDDRATALLRESLALNRKVGHMRAIARDLTYLGEIASDSGEDQAAYALHAEGLAIAKELADEAAMAASLAGLARVADARGEPERAARLFGAADALCWASGRVLDPVDSHALDRHIAAVRAALSEQAFAAAWAAGQALLSDDAIAEALAEPR